MYSRVEKRVEKFIRSSGEIKFTPTTADTSHKASMNYVKHDVVYTYHSGSSGDKLGDFFLCTEFPKMYHMGGLNLTRKYEPGLRVFFFNMTVERAMLEARGLRVEKLTIIGTEELLVETFLNYGFKVGHLSASVYKGIKNLKA